MFVAHHFDTHSTTNHPTSPNSDPFPCSLSPAGSVLDGLGFAHPSQSRQLAWPNRVHLRCGLGVSHSVAPDHASRHRPYSVLLVLSRFNNAGLSPALISAPWRTRDGLRADRLIIWPDNMEKKWDGTGGRPSLNFSGFLAGKIVHVAPKKGPPFLDTRARKAIKPS